VTGDLNLLREFVPCFVEDVRDALCEVLNVLYGCEVVGVESRELAYDKGIVFHFFLTIVLDASFHYVKISWVDVDCDGKWCAV